MYFTGATVAGTDSVPNEDWSAVTPDLVVVLDGATIRTETGCRHGAAWYARKLGAAILAGAAARSTSLDVVLSDAIVSVATLHRECDLSHPGTPSAAVAIVRLDDTVLRWLVLGDVTVMLDTTGEGVGVISDQRISASAAMQRREADRYLIGSTEKAQALLAMKHAELAARGLEYWVAAADSTAVEHAIMGQVSVSEVRRLAVMTDGAARFVDMLNLGQWDTALDLISQRGPRVLIERVRRAESSDPAGALWRRNKSSDDATVVYAESPAFAQPAPAPAAERPELTREAQLAAAAPLLAVLNHPSIYGDGRMVRR